MKKLRLILFVVLVFVFGESCLANPGFAYVASATGYNAGSGTALSTSSTLNLLADDVIVGWATWADGDSTISSFNDGASNSLTMESVHSYGTLVYGCIGIKVAVSANATATFTVTLGTARAYRGIMVMQFRPDAGDTVSKDSSATGSGTGGVSFLSGNIDTAGTDEVVVGASSFYNTQAEFTSKIGDVAADGTVSITYSSMWYRILTSTASGIHAEQVVNDATSWVCDIISVKSIASDIRRFNCTTLGVCP